MAHFPPNALAFAQILETDYGLNPLMRQLVAMRRIEKIWLAIVPAQLSVHTRLGQVHEGKLHVYCGNAAVAGKLRQLTTRLSQALAVEHIFADLVIKVRQEPSITREKEVQQRELPHVAVQELTSLREALSEGVLKHALQSLLEHAKMRNE